MVDRQQVHHSPIPGRERRYLTIHRLRQKGRIDFLNLASYYRFKPCFGVAAIGVDGPHQLASVPRFEVCIEISVVQKIDALLQALVVISESAILGGGWVQEQQAQAGGLGMGRRKIENQAL